MAPGVVVCGGVSHSLISLSLMPSRANKPLSKIVLILDTSISVEKHLRHRAYSRVADVEDEEEEDSPGRGFVFPV